MSKEKRPDLRLIKSQETDDANDIISNNLSPIEGAPPPQLSFTKDGALRKTAHNVAVLLRFAPPWRDQLWWDELTQRPRWCIQPEKLLSEEPDPPVTNAIVRDPDTITIQGWIDREYSVGITSAVIYEGVMRAALWNPRHPVREWLETLDWDGEERLTTWLTRYCNAHEDAVEVVQAIGRMFLISAVARIYEPGCKVDHMLVLEGPQGRNKSSALRLLAGDDWFTDNLPPLSDNKAAIEALEGVWLVEVAELDAIRGKEATRVKSFLTRQVDHVRKSYARFVSDNPRQCVFAGTTNETEYLTDATGNRRFWPVRVDDIDLMGLAKVREQLWAEAVCKYKRGVPWWPSNKEEKLLDAQRANRESQHPWTNVIRAYLRGKPTTVTTEELLEEAIGKAQEHWTHGDKICLGTIMARETGWVKARLRQGDQRVWGYKRVSGAGLEMAPDMEGAELIKRPVAKDLDGADLISRGEIHYEEGHTCRFQQQRDQDGSIIFVCPDCGELG